MNRDIIENLLRYTEQPESESAITESKIIDIMTEGLKFVDDMFKENHEISEFSGIQKLRVYAISKTDMHIRKDRYMNIVVCG